MLRASRAIVACAILILNAAARGDDGSSTYDSPTRTEPNHSNPLRQAKAEGPSPLSSGPKASDNSGSIGGPSWPSPMIPQSSFAPSNAPIPPRNLAPTQSPHNGEIIPGIPSHASQFFQQPQAADDCNATDSEYPKSMDYSRNNGQNSAWQVPAPYEPAHYPRALGFGEPLVGTSWQNRPFHVDYFAGTMVGDDAIDGVIGQETGFFTGGRVGWDYDYYWGVDTRLGLAWMALYDKKHPAINLGNGNIIDWDMNLLYYPFGDAKWRPFILLGTGISQFDSFGPSPAAYNSTMFELPFGAGLKYRFNEWLAFRFEVIDNYVVGVGSLDSMHNISFDTGFEYHFGGQRRTYWPWNPNPKH
jgi:hypothetical protein